MKGSIMMFTVLFFSLVNMTGQNIDNSFFQNADKIFKAHIQNDVVNYDAIKKDANFEKIIQTIAVADFENLKAETKKAFLINAYNLLVINEIIKNNLTKSVNDKSNFFDDKSNLVGGKKISLNTLEKEYLLKSYGDSRFHFVLVCGAKGCPPITNFAYMPNTLDEQLEAQTKKSINNPAFIKVDMGAKRVNLSQIFLWYASDFGGNKKAILNYINKYRNTSIPSDFSIDYYTYDWTLNAQISSVDEAETEIDNNSSRYVVSAAVPKGTTETKIFNNLYTQKTRPNSESDFNARSNFFTTSLSFLYGVSNRFNAGFDLRYRRTSNTGADISPLNVFGGDADSRRQGVTGIGPKIRWAPFKKLTNFSVQSALWIPTGENLQGNATEPFIEWDGAIWVTQFFNDFSIGSRFSIFAEIDFWLEDIGKKNEGDLNRLSTPATLIFSYFPNPKTTVYLLSNFSPFWQTDFDYFAQAGIGTKYQVTPNLEFEVLYTAFTNESLSNNNGQASTFNIGVRISR